MRSLKLALLLPTLLILCWFTGCSSSAAESAKQPPPATVENARKETDLATIKLTPQAEQRLGIVTTQIEMRDVPRTLNLSGEVVTPQGQTMTVPAPMAGTLIAASQGSSPVIGTAVRKGQPLYRISPYLPPERDLRLQLEREVATITERVNAARQKKERAEILANEKAGSVRAVEEAQAELSIAEADLKGARARLEQFGTGSLRSEFHLAITAPMSGIVQKVNVNAGQEVAGGTVLLEIANLSTVWIRVPVYVGDLNEVRRNQTARIQPLDEAGEGPVRFAKPVNAPPTADPAAATADLYFALPNTNNSLRPGQRVGVTLTTQKPESGLAIPWAAVVHDIQGGTWVYENTAPQTYVRRLVEVQRVANGIALLARAPATGTKIVTTGAAELFSTEFSTGK